MSNENELETIEIYNAVEDKPLADETNESKETKDEAVDTEVDAAASEEQPKPKKKGGWLKKLEKKDSEIAELRAQLTKAKPDETKQVVEVKKPVENDYATPSEYLEALADYKAETKLKAFEDKLKSEKTKEVATKEFSQKQSEYNSKAVEFVKEKPDFHQVLQADFEENGPLEFSPLVNSLLIDSDLGPAIVYEFAKDRELLEKLNEMTPTQAMREFVKLESGLVKPKTETKKQTTAPAPITPIKTSKASSTASKDPYGEGISFAEYDKRRMEQERLKRA